MRGSWGARRQPSTPSTALKPPWITHGTVRDPRPNCAGAAPLPHPCCIKYHRLPAPRPALENGGILRCKNTAPAVSLRLLPAGMFLLPSPSVKLRINVLMLRWLSPLKGRLATLWLGPVAVSDSLGPTGRPTCCPAPDRASPACWRGVMSLGVRSGLAGARAGGLDLLMPFT